MIKDFIIKCTSANLKLTPFEKGFKCPKGKEAKGWNIENNAFATVEDFGNRINEERNLGLLHAWSGTCAIDVDDYQRTKEFFKFAGIDLDALFESDDVVQVKSPSDNRGKLLYRLKQPLKSKQLNYNHDLLGGADAVDKNAVVDFRCATATGNTCQDVIYGYHPDKLGKIDGKYELVGDINNIPDIPPRLEQLWKAILQDSEKLTHTGTGQDFEEVRVSDEALLEMLQCISADCGREDWMKVGHALKSIDEPFTTFDAWSRQSSKYNEYETRRLWNTGKRLHGWNLGTLINLAKKNGYIRNYKNHAWEAKLKELEDLKKLINK